MHIISLLILIKNNMKSHTFGFYNEETGWRCNLLSGCWPSVQGRVRDQKSGDPARQEPLRFVHLEQPGSDQKPHMLESAAVRRECTSVTSNQVQSPAPACRFGPQDVGASPSCDRAPALPPPGYLGLWIYRSESPQAGRCAPAARRRLPRRWIWHRDFSFHLLASAVRKRTERRD